MICTRGMSNASQAKLALQVYFVPGTQRQLVLLFRRLPPLAVPVGAYYYHSGQPAPPYTGAVDESLLLYSYVDDRSAEPGHTLPSTALILV